MVGIWCVQLRQEHHQVLADNADLREKNAQLHKMNVHLYQQLAQVRTNRQKDEDKRFSGRCHPHDV
jgi:hypothetical protein